MSCHADTIRLPEDKIKSRVLQLQQHMHFDAALPMALRMEWEDDRRALLAENQRYEKALRRIALDDPGKQEAVLIAREALAGDTE